MNIKDCNQYYEHTYTGRRYILLQSMEWFKENTFADGNGYFWINEDEFKKWVETSSDDEINYIPAMYIDDINNGLSMWSEKYKNTFKEYCWAMKREITVETDPEYFI